MEERASTVERIEFGDIAQAPPTRLDVVRKPKRPVSLAQKTSDLHRLKAIEAYRLLKKKKRAVAGPGDEAPHFL